MVTHLLSLGPFMFDMIDITTSISSPTPGPSADLGVGIEGTIAPYLAHRFGNGHIPSSTPFVEYFYSLHSVFTLVVTLTRVVLDI